MILDTCAFLWLARGDHHKLTQSTLDTINQTPDVHIVAVTGFEICLKQASGKLRFKIPARQWLDSALDRYRINVIPMHLEICVVSAELPKIHKDPCDRFIIAAALLHSIPVVTADKRFIEYGVRVLS
jgi:PIN domain nuclease of toxin-antitoxin system